MNASKEKRDKFFEYFNSEERLQGCKIVSEYLTMDKHILIEDEFGILTTSPRSLMYGYYPKENMALDRRQYFINRADKTHNFLYSYDKIKFINATTKVEIICPIHNEFWQDPCHHIAGAGCPKCASTKMLIKKGFNIWGDVEDSFTAENYENMTNEEIGSALGFSRYKVFKRLNELSLFRRERWKKENFDEYANRIRLLCIEEDRLIPEREYCNYENIPSYRWFKENKGSRKIESSHDFSRVLGFIPTRTATKDECIIAIGYMVGRYGANLSYDDFRNTKLNEVGISTIRKYFGTMNNMKKEMGLIVNQESMIDKIKPIVEMEKDLIRLYTEIGHTPTQHEIDECEYCQSASTYFHKIGRINDIYDRYGIVPNKEFVAPGMTNEDIIIQYKNYIDNLGYVPSHYRASSDQDVLSPTTVMRRFKMTWLEFIKYIGYDVERSAYGRRSYASDGSLCLSMFELEIHEILIDIGAHIVKETNYKDFLVDEKLKKLAGNKRCDWLINLSNSVFVIEYFGLMQSDKYTERHDFKVDLIKQDIEKDYIFVPLYQRDIIRKDFKRVLMDKLNLKGE